ncbi:hypothetical protein [Methanoculleus bourgensis]|nr:hypothetical protein [Methanoculleus bourgensis]
MRVPEPGRGIPGRSVYEMMGSLSVGEVTRVVASAIGWLRSAAFSPLFP